MARKTLSMRQIHEILRLKYQNRLSIREIAASCGLPTSTVGDYLQRAEIAGIGWPAPEGLSEQQLLAKLGGMPAYVSVLRFMKSHGLFKRPRRGPVHSPGAQAAERRFEAREMI